MYEYVWSTPKVKRAVEQKGASESVLVVLLATLHERADTIGTHQVKVVMVDTPERKPQPSEQLPVSIQYPAKPQSDAEITVVGQKPQSALTVSTRQS